MEAFLGSAALGVVWYGAYRDYIDEKDRYGFFLNAADEADREADKIRYRMQERISARLTNAERRHVLEFGALCGWMYACNLIETFLLAAPPGVASVEGFSATLEIPRKSKTRSVLRSFFFPGLGQKYLGKSVKGLFFQAVFITTAALTLKARKDYDIATIDYEIAREALDSAETQVQVEEAREVVSLRWDERRDQERKRNAYYIILGSLWALNVLDASLSDGGAAPGGRVGFETSVIPSGLHTGIRIGF